MSYACIKPVTMYMEASANKRKRVRKHSRSVDVDKILKQNKRIKTVIHKRRDNTNWKSNNRRLVLEELASFLDILDDVVDIFDSEDFDCGEVPDELDSNY
jgi:hypothetical protein